MKTDDLIAKLADQAQPVKRLPSPMKLLLLWLGVAFAILVAEFLYWGPRPDFMIQMHTPLFWIESILLLMSSIVAGGAALMLAVPGRKISRLVLVLPALVFITLLLLSFGSHYGGGMHADSSSMMTNWNGITSSENRACLITCSFVFFPVWMALMLILRRGASLTLAASGALSFFAVAALSAFGMQMTCCHDLPLHHVVYHILPLGILALVGVVAGRWLLRWDKKLT